MVKSEVIHMRVDPDLKAKAEQLADEQHRTLANYIETLILRDWQQAEYNKYREELQKRKIKP